MNPAIGGGTVPPYLRTRLSLHMFLTFAVMGAWQSVLVRHLYFLTFTNTQAGMIIATSALPPSCAASSSITR